MKITSISSGSSCVSQLLFASWAVAAGRVGAFVAPASQRALGAGQLSRDLAVGALRADASPSQSSSGGSKSSSSSSKTSGIKVGTAPAEIADMTRSMRNQMRDAIWKASDAMNHAVQDVPSVGKSDTNEKLARLGDMVEKIDEKYFGTYNRGTGATTSYLDSIGTAAAEGAETEAGKGATGGSPKDDKPDKDKGEDKKVAKAANDAASAVTEAKDAAAKSSKKGDARTESASAAVDAAADSVKAKADESAGSAAGTVQLDRPKQVQGVFDDLQKKAVEYYKSSPVAKATSSVPGTKFGSSSSEGVATAMPDVVQTLETELESLLTESSFKPRRLKNERKQKLVAAIEAMEKAYPADANPLADPALSGQWSVVYSSSTRSVGRALKGTLAKLFKTSDARQVVNSEASSIINACRARLRLTPLSLQVAQKGKYRSTAERQVSVDLSVSGGRKLLRGLLPGLPAGKVSAEVTYLSKRWRICRVGGVTVAFRKTGD